jgi:hypothetical protein
MDTYKLLILTVNINSVIMTKFKDSLRLIDPITIGICAMIIVITIYLFMMPKIIPNNSNSAVAYRINNLQTRRVNCENINSSMMSDQSAIISQLNELISSADSQVASAPSKYPQYLTYIVSGNYNNPSPGNIYMLTLKNNAAVFSIANPNGSTGISNNSGAIFSSPPYNSG